MKHNIVITGQHHSLSALALRSHIRRCIMAALEEEGVNCA